MKKNIKNFLALVLYLMLFSVSGILIYLSIFFIPVNKQILTSIESLENFKEGQKFKIVDESDAYTILSSDGELFYALNDGNDDLSLIRGDVYIISNNRIFSQVDNSINRLSKHVSSNNSEESLSFDLSLETSSPSLYNMHPENYFENTFEVISNSERFNKEEKDTLNNEKQEKSSGESISENSDSIGDDADFSNSTSVEKNKLENETLSKDSSSSVEENSDSIGDDADFSNSTSMEQNKLENRTLSKDNSSSMEERITERLLSKVPENKRLEVKDSLISQANSEYKKNALMTISDRISGFTIDYPSYTDNINGVITVFSDPTCPYCKRLHNDMDKLRYKGYTVRYLPIPRNGMESEIVPQIAGVSCATKENAPVLMDKLFKGERFSTQNIPERCFDNISNYFKLLMDIGGDRTPYIFNSKGLSSEGYSTVDNLLNDLGME